MDAARPAPAFAAFYRSHVADVTRLVYTLVGSWSAAEDLAAEAFVRACRDWDRVGSFERPGSWVRTVAVNLATSRARRLAVEARALARLGGRREAEDRTLPPEAEELWSYVRRLPRRQAQVTALRYAADLSIAEIAVAMECAEGTVKAHLHAARQSLARMLGEDAGGVR